MAISITNIITAIENKIAALDSSVSSQDMRHYFSAAGLTNTTITQYYDSAGLLPTADSDYKGQIVLVSNPSSASSGNSLYICTDSGGGVAWSAWQTLDSASSYSFQGSTSGYSSGGYSGPTGYENTIDKFPFASDGNATDVGDLTAGLYLAAGQSSTTNGYTSGGATTGSPAPPTLQPTWPAINYKDFINKFSFSSDGNATDVGDLTQNVSYVTGQSSENNGYSSGGVAGYSGGATVSNVIDKFPFASDGNATDVGDLTGTRRSGAGQSSTASGYHSGGQNPPETPGFLNIIEKFPFSSDANATDVGDLTVARSGMGGQSSTASGYSTGGTAAVATQNVIDKFPFSSDANATDVGDITVARDVVAGQSSTASGYTSGGVAPTDPTTWVNTIDKFPFSSDGNATDVGDLTVARRVTAGQQV